MFSQVLVTKDLYGWDDFNESGIIVNQRGDLKYYQTVIAVGSDVHQVSPGDKVAINFSKYAVFKEDPNSVKAMNDNPIVGFRLNEVDMVDSNGESVTCLMIDQRDIQYVMEDFDEVAYNSKDELIKIETPPQLILPDKRIKTK